MAYCLSFLCDPVTNFFKGLWTDFITEKLSNITSSAKRVEEMEKKMKDLENKRDEIKAHVYDNNINNLKIPTSVPKWLEDVEKIEKDFDKIPSNNDGCLNLKTKYEAGEDALKLTEKIDDLITQSKEITWTNAKKPLGRVDSKHPPSTSASGGDTRTGFESRNKIFNYALKLLQQNDDGAARVIALCGMGGVGKTTLMKQLKKAAEDNKMFKWILVVAIGKTPNLFKIQEVIAAHTGESLTDTNETLRASLLSKRFQAFSERKEKSLVILDDMWKESKIKLKDIGLESPLPNGVKLLLTSRDVEVCQQIAANVDADYAFEVVEVKVLEEGEARDFFFRITGAKYDQLYGIGCDIVKKCSCLPLAIKLTAGALKCQKGREEKVWRYTLKCLKKYEVDERLHEIVEISYNSLPREEDKAIFLLCGLFPEDSNIPIEDLTRYAWGLKLLNKVYTMEEARDSIEVSVSNLKNAYLLMDGDSHHSDCVKLHDLVLLFAVATVSKGGEDGCWIIHHEDDFSNWSEATSMSQSCKRISLACNGMSKFPSDFRFPNLSLLKLMQGDESLRFPQDFYVGMEKLQVIAFEKLEYPLVPTSFECSINLRTLCFDECSLLFDLTCIGNLSNLEVLSFANSGITTIPSTFKNLKKLRLLDVTGCYNLVIDDGVLKSLVKLEELYMIPYDEKACCFTNNNNSELAERSKNLCALEFEFIGNNAHMKNVSCEKLKRFKLSVGCSFTEVRNALGTRQVDTHSYENSLKLITNRKELELLKSMINELFKRTDALYLQVNDMSTLPYSSFSNLRLLVVSECAELKYLFTWSVATNLSKLEYLEISSCDAMEAVIHTENNGSDIILFSNLKYLRLAGLRKLLCFCNNINVIELPRLMELQLVGLPNISSIYTDRATSFVSSNNIPPTQSFLNKEDATPKLEKLFVSDMENLKEIWPPQFNISNLCPLRELKVEGCDSIEVLFNMDFGEIEQLSSSLRSITVERCDSLVKLFSCNPFPFLNNLQELKVERCDSIQLLFNTDLGRAGKSEEQDAAPKLEKLVVSNMENLKEIWPPQFNISNMCPLRELTIEGCGSIEVLFNMDFGEIEQLSSSLRSIKVYRCDSLVKLFSCNPFPFLNNLQALKVESCRSIKVLFDTDLGLAGKSEEQVCSSSLRSINVAKCESLVNLLPSNPMPLFNHLEELQVRWCASVEVIFDMDMGCVGETDEVSSSRLRSIELEELGKLREVWRIKDAGNNNLIHGFEAVESIHIQICRRFENLITPATTTFDMRALKKVEIERCGRERRRKNELVEKEKEISKIAFPSSLLPTFHKLTLYYGYEDVEVVFEITSPISREPPHNTPQQLIILPNLEELELSCLEKMSHVWKYDWNEFLILQKPQSQSSFHNLTTIEMKWCNSIKYLFSPLMAKLLSNLKKIKIMNCDGIEEVVLNRDDEDTSLYPHINSSLFPQLDILDLSSLDKLKCIGGSGNGISTDSHDQLKISQASWSLCQYAKEISIKVCDALSSVIPWYVVGQMQKLQVLKIRDCKSMTEVFETQEINNKSCTDTGKSLPRQEYITMLKLPKLKILKIEGCNLLKYLFTFSTLESLTQLEELEMEDCEAMEVIVTEENGEQTTASDVVVFPHLKSIKLIKLSNFVGFFLGKNQFVWPALEKVVISECPQITVFTYGRSTAPELKFINTSLGKHSVECGLNFHVTTTSDQARLPVYESTSLYRRLPWSYHNLIEVDMKNYNPSGGQQSLFSSEEVSQLQKLEIVRFVACEDIEEIFDSETDAEIPNLRQVDLEDLESLKYIWKSKQGTVLKFPNLTRLSIDSCESLEYVFTCPMVGSLLQLQELVISRCWNMKVIVKGEEEEECDAIVNATVEFPCLKSLKLWNLSSLEGFCIGKEAFEFPSLDTLQIGYGCEKMRVFTNGDLSAPKLYAISNIWGRKYNIHNRLNSFIENFTKGDLSHLPYYYVY